jgi:hypothetical protein
LVLASFGVASEEVLGEGAVGRFGAVEGAVPILVGVAATSEAAAKVAGVRADVAGDGIDDGIRGGGRAGSGGVVAHDGFGGGGHGCVDGGGLGRRVGVVVVMLLLQGVADEAVELNVFVGNFLGCMDSSLAEPT